MTSLWQFATPDMSFLTWFFGVISFHFLLWVFAPLQHLIYKYCYCNIVEGSFDCFSTLFLGRQLLALHDNSRVEILKCFDVAKAPLAWNIFPSFHRICRSKLESWAANCSRANVCASKWLWRWRISRSRAPNARPSPLKLKHKRFDDFWFLISLLFPFLLI